MIFAPYHIHQSAATLQDAHLIAPTQAALIRSSLEGMPYPGASASASSRGLDGCIGIPSWQLTKLTLLTFQSRMQAYSLRQLAVLRMFMTPLKMPLLDPFACFGAILLVCHIAGELAVKTKLIPRISAYILLGIILGPSCLNMMDTGFLTEMRVFIDTALGLILFMIGRHLDLTWLKNDSALLKTSVCQVGLIFLLTIGLTLWLHGNLVEGFFISIVACTTSASILILVTQDLNAEGPVTRRSLLMTGMDNFLALSIFTLALPFVEPTTRHHGHLVLDAGYKFFGSFLVAFLTFKLFAFLALTLFEKTKQKQFILIISFLILLSALCRYLELSNLLALIAFGAATRNFDRKHALLDVDLSFLTYLLFMPLFFITGCALNFTGFLKAPWVVMGYVIIRVVAKGGALLMFRSKARLSFKQTLALIGTATPMSGIAAGLASNLYDFNPTFGSPVMLIASASIAFWGIFGPILVQQALLHSGEAFDHLKKI